MISNPIEIITGDTAYPAPFTHRVMIFCEEKNISYTLTKIDTENKPGWFLAIAPLGLVPVMRIDQQVIPDSHAICEYLDKFTEPYFFNVDQSVGLQFANTLADETARSVKQGNIQSADFTELDKLLVTLNKHCKLPFFYGEQFSLTDIYLLSHILWLNALEQKKLLQPVIQKHQNVSAWLSTMKQRTSVKKTMGENYADEFVGLLKRYGLIP